MAKEMDQLALYADALQCGVAGWRQIWGDPLPSGTILVISYVGVAALILRVASQVTDREHWLWTLCGLFFLFQALNTPLDLHAFAWTFGRCLARAQGWYEDRARVQLTLLVGVGICALLSLVASLIVFRRSLLSNFLLILGVSIALGITIIKGVSFHATELILGANFGPMRGADLIELSGILIAASATWKRRPSGSRGLPRD